MGFVNKMDQNYFQEQQPNKFHYYNQNMGFVNKMDQNMVRYNIDIRMKIWCLFEWCS